jgi:hypothetical protein
MNKKNRETLLLIFTTFYKNAALFLSMTLIFVRLKTKKFTDQVLIHLIFDRNFIVRTLDSDIIHLIEFNNVNLFTYVY